TATRDPELADSRSADFRRRSTSIHGHDRHDLGHRGSLGASTGSQVRCATERGLHPALALPAVLSTACRDHCPTSTRSSGSAEASEILEETPVMFKEFRNLQRKS